MSKLNTTSPPVHPEVVGGFSLSSLGGRRGTGRGRPSTLQGFPSPQPSPRPTGRGGSCLRTTAQPTTSGCTASPQHLIGRDRLRSSALVSARRVPLIVAEPGIAAVARFHHMMDGSGMLDSQLAGHDGRVARAASSANIKNRPLSDPFREERDLEFGHFCEDIPGELSLKTWG